MRINSICMKRGRQLGLTVTTIAPLMASLPHFSLHPSFPSQTPWGSEAALVRWKEHWPWGHGTWGGYPPGTPKLVIPKPLSFSIFHSKSGETNYMK